MGDVPVEFLFAAAFSGVFCASTVPLIRRYVESTLSLWSMSTIRKSRVTGQGWTVAAFVVDPGGGTCSKPADIAASAAVKKAGALQYAN